MLILLDRLACWWLDRRNIRAIYAATESNEFTQLKVELAQQDAARIKVFSIGDIEWWAGYDLESCIQTSSDCSGLDCLELLDGCEHELSDEEMNRLIYVDEDGRKKTFAEQLEIEIYRGTPVPFLFATTEF